MTNGTIAPDPGPVSERLQQTLAIALALLLLLGLVVYFVPRQPEIAQAMAEGRRQAAAAAVERQRIASEIAAEGTARSRREAVALGEDGASGNLTRLPPRPPLTPPGGVALGAPPLPGEPAAAPAEPEAETPAAVPEPAAPAAPLFARPVAVDTATLQIRRGRVRLAGIEAVPLSERCEAASGAWFCGAEARTQFRAYLRGRSVECPIPPDFGTDEQEAEAACRLAGQDVGGWLVSQGWARAVVGGPYAKAETAAREAGRGIWATARPASGSAAPSP